MRYTLTETTRLLGQHTIGQYDTTYDAIRGLIQYIGHIPQWEWIQNHYIVIRANDNITGTQYNITSTDIDRLGRVNRATDFVSIVDSIIPNNDIVSEEVDITDSIHESLCTLSNYRMKEVLDNASYSIFDQHDKSDQEQLALAIGKAILNGLIVDAIKCAIDNHNEN